MKKRYIQTLMLLLAALLVSHNAKAQEPGTSTVSTGPTVRGDVYGGGNVANVGGNTKVFLLGGTVNGDVYGGGKGRLEAGKAGEDGYVSPIAATVGSTKVNLNGMDASEYKEAYSSWGLEQAEKDGPYTVANTGVKGCVVKGSIFGCNNINGTPLGDATVHVYKTQNANASQIGNTNEVTDAKVKNRYDLTAVYGGGNLAPFIPAAANESTASTYVIIDGCDLTSIETVYGGGNAASTPATNVTVNGTYEINELFGGGNGKDPIPYGSTTRENPGANVGYRNYSSYDENTGKWVDDVEADTKAERIAEGSPYLYGSGAASVNIYGGTVHAVFGGSNTKGNVRISAVTLLEDQDACEFCVDEAYGGGKSAPMDAEAKLLMSCIPGLKAAYGGAEAANIEGDVTLTITNGTFDRVFGGNNISGTIGGTITVNIEETGCKPIVIGQLYGGGNQAPYTGTTGPTVNVRSFTSIGEVYGGGYGKTAKVTGDTHVNINVSKGKYADDAFDEGDENREPADVVDKEKGTIRRTIQFTEYERTDDGNFVMEGDVRKTINQSVEVVLPIHEKDKIGAITNVYGGGNSAPVGGSTYVNIGTSATETYESLTDKDSTTDTDERVKTVEGADIRGNVYGGGNNAEVTGNTNVVIGEKYVAPSTPTPDPSSTLEP